MAKHDIWTDVRSGRFVFADGPERRLLREYTERLMENLARRRREQAEQAAAKLSSAKQKIYELEYLVVLVPDYSISSQLLFD